MAFERRTTLAGSERKALPGSQAVGTIQPDETVRVTVVLRRKGADPTVPTGTGPQTHLTHEQFNAAARGGSWRYCAGREVRS